MTIQPLSNRPREISVTEPIEPAYDRVKLMLFKPFDLTKWIVIGFCAWLAGLGESGRGGGGGFNNLNNHGSNAQPAEEFRHFYGKARDYVLANLDWIIPSAVFLVALGLAIWLLLIWLSSRGKFMFLHCVVHDKAEVDVPWTRYSAEANSLMCFRIVVGLIGMVLFLPLLVIVIVNVVRMVLRGEPDVPGIVLVAGLVMVMIPLSIIFALIRKFTMDFVVPMMFLRGGTCVARWREFWKLLSANPGKFTVYILFQIVLGMAIGAAIMAVVLVTCCVAACFLAIPFIGTVLLLPVLVFKRAYSLYYLAQYGPEYNVFGEFSSPATSGPQSPLPG